MDREQEFERLKSLSALSEDADGKEAFLRSLMPFYEMMEKVRDASVPEETLTEKEKIEDEERFLTLQADLPDAFSEPGRLLALSERREEAYYSVPRSI